MTHTFEAMNGLFLEDLKIGQSAMFGRTVTEADISAFAGVSGDTNPIHLHDGFARTTRFGIGRITQKLARDRCTGDAAHDVGLAQAILGGELEQHFGCTHA